MAELSIQCLHAGLQSLLVATPRAGKWQAFGVPLGGAVDRRSATLANWLVGNPADTPTLEMSLQGATLRFRGSAQIALAGGRAGLFVNGTPVFPYGTLEIAAGDTLSVGSITEGCRVYLAVGGTWRVPRILDSSSALFVGGSYRNGELKLATELRIDAGPPIHRRALATNEWWHPPAGELLLPVYPGPELERFSATAVARFFGSAWAVGTASNRMGIRLSGPAVSAPAIDLVSSPVLPGTVQLPPGGTPLLLLADAQTTGGYPRLVTVAESALDELGQLRPGQAVRFTLR